MDGTLRIDHHPILSAQSATKIRRMTTTNKKECCKCHTTKTIEEFRLCRLYKRVSEGEYRRSECRKCEKRIASQLREALKAAPPKPKICEFPECASKGPLVPDHCHVTGDFKGWLCRNHNQALGKLSFGQSSERAAVINAMKYLNVRFEILKEGDG